MAGINLRPAKSPVTPKDDDGAHGVLVDLVPRMVRRRHVSLKRRGQLPLHSRCLPEPRSDLLSPVTVFVAGVIPMMRERCLACRPAEQFASDPDATFARHGSLRDAR